MSDNKSETCVPELEVGAILKRVWFRSYDGSLKKSEDRKIYTITAVVQETAVREGEEEKGVYYVIIPVGHSIKDSRIYSSQEVSQFFTPIVITEGNPGAYTCYCDPDKHRYFEYKDVEP